MELLQIIWGNLVTENSELVKLFNIPLAFIETTVTILLLTTILNIKNTRKQKLIYIICFSIFILIGGFFIPEPYNTFLNLILFPIFIVFIFKTSILKSIVALITQYFVFVVVGIIFLNLYIGIFNISTEVTTTTPIYRATASLLQYILIYVLYRFCKKNEININLLDTMNRKNNITLVINFIIGIIAIAIQSYLVTRFNDSIPFGITFGSLLILVAYFFINLYSLSRTTKLELTTKDLEEEKLYNKTLSIMYDNISAFKHDFNNIVQAIGGYVSTKDIPGLKRYYTELLDDCQRVNSLNILSPEVINNPAIYSLLTSKYHVAEEKGIKVTMDIFLDLNSINMKIYEFTRILGILVDNAIEASNKCDVKIVNITIRKDGKLPRQLLIIENTYINKDVDTTKIFEKGYSSKTDEDTAKHGLGLWEVRKILNKNTNLNLHTEKDNTFFRQQLEIYL